MLGKREKREDEGESGAPALEGQGGPVSVIAKGMRVVGDCVSDGSVRIEGSVTGNVRAKKVHLTESGSVRGDVLSAEGGAGDEVFLVGGQVGGAVSGADVEVRRGGSVAGAVTADRAIIRGRVEGGIVVRDLLAIEETAVVEGDIQARRLAIKDGGQFDGAIRMTTSAKPENPGATP